MIFQDTFLLVARDSNRLAIIPPTAKMSRNLKKLWYASIPSDASRIRPATELKKISGANPTIEIKPTVVPVSPEEILDSSKSAKYTPRNA